MRIENRGAKIFGLAVFTSICLGIFAYLYVAAGGHIRFSQPYHASAEVPTAFQLVKNADVRSAGVKVGVISNIQNIGDAGKVEFEINKKNFPVYRDAVVEVRTKTLVGENYLDLNPGTPPAGKLEQNAVLPLAQAHEAVQLDQILDSLGPETRRRVQADLQTLAPGLKGTGPTMNRIWAAMKPNARDGGIVLRVLNAQRGQLGSLIANTGEVMQAFGDRTAQVRVLATQAKETAIAAHSRDQQMRAAIRELGPTLVQAKSSTGNLAAFSTRSTPTIRDLADVSAQLQPVVKHLRPAIAATRSLFKILPSSLRAANPLFSELKPFSTKLSPVVNALDAVLRQGSPAVDYLAPFADEIGSMFANNGAVFATKDAIGTKGRVHAIIGANSIAQFNDDEKKLLKGLMDAGAGEVFNSERTNPYPKPGDISKPTDGNGSYPRVEASK